MGVEVQLHTRIFNFGTRWEWSASCPGRFNLRGKSLRYTLDWL